MRAAERASPRRLAAEPGEAIVEAALTALKPPAMACILAVGDLGARRSSYRPELTLLAVYDPPSSAAVGDLHPLIERVIKNLGRILSDSIGETISSLP